MRAGAVAAAVTAISGALLLSGCGLSRTLSDRVDAIPPAYAPEPEGPAAASGAIWQGSGRLLLAEDRRAHNVGDLLTIALVEQVNAEKSNSQKASRASSNSIGTGDNALLSWMPDKLFSGSSSSSFDGAGSTQQTNRLSGEMTVTVQRVLPNGALIVAGDRRLTLTRGEEQLQFTGIVRPEDIDANNRVLSTRVADARVRYSGTGEVAAQVRQGWLSRFFSAINPF